MLEIQSFIFGPFQENTYVVHDHTLEGIIVDPGCTQLSEQQQLQQYVESHDLKISKT